MKNKNEPFEEPLVFDMELPGEWERLQGNLPPELYLSLMEDITRCPMCSDADKARALKNIKTTSQ